MTWCVEERNAPYGDIKARALGKSSLVRIGSPRPSAGEELGVRGGVRGILLC